MDEQLATALRECRAGQGHRRTGFRILAIPVRTPVVDLAVVPAFAPAFVRHPSASNPRRVRSDVADRMQRLHFLRNRIAHHEPIHRRNLARDHAQLLEPVGWMCSNSRDWIAATSRTPAVVAARP